MAEDDFDLFEDDPSTEPADTGESQPDTSQYVSVDEYQKLTGQLNSLKAEVEAARQFKDDLARVTSGETSNPGADYINQFAQDPNRFVETIVDKAVQQSRQEMQAQSLVAEYEQKNPDLVPYKEYIGVEYQKLASELQSQGRVMDQRAMLEESMNRFRTKFNVGVQNAATENRIGEARRQVMNLNANNSQPGKFSQRQAEEAIWNMPADKFEQETRRYLRQSYQ